MCSNDAVTATRVGGKYSESSDKVYIYIWLVSVLGLLMKSITIANIQLVLMCFLVAY